MRLRIRADEFRRHAFALRARAGHGDQRLGDVDAHGIPARAQACAPRRAWWRPAPQPMSSTERAPLGGHRVGQQRLDGLIASGRAAPARPPRPVPRRRSTVPPCLRWAAFPCDLTMAACANSSRLEVKRRGRAQAMNLREVRRESAISGACHGARTITARGRQGCRQSASAFCSERNRSAPTPQSDTNIMKCAFCDIGNSVNPGTPWPPDA